MAAMVEQHAAVASGKVLPLVVPRRHVQGEPVAEHERGRLGPVRPDHVHRQLGPVRLDHVHRQLGPVERADPRLAAGAFVERLAPGHVGHRPGPPDQGALGGHRGGGGHADPGRGDRHPPGGPAATGPAGRHPTYSLGTRALTPHTTS